MFKKILIANRGEIAVRLVRACRDLDISPVVVYSEADRNSLAVRLSDEAVHIGPAVALKSYLSIEKILEAALCTGAEAIHPGYGFLSENAEFAAAVESANLTFIGPSSVAIEKMGNKLCARDIALQAGATIVPGVQGSIKNVDDLLKIANEIGFPIMLKAAAGGGGKGMRIVYSPNELHSAFQLATSEAQSAFKDSTIYLERYIEKSRHIEIQILGDKYGNIIHLGERECSIQRRNQKIIEECPSPINDIELRHRMGEVAVNIAKAAGYYSAGTVEFLVDENRKFYFLEMNTRLQVEHPVTELVTGLDLAVLQIEIAAGKVLLLKQENVTMRGTAIECRVYAEDPSCNFMPSPGKVTALRIPEGPGVRVDSGIFEGWDIPLEYDPLLLKLICWGETREQALKRLERSLKEFVLCGFSNNLDFFLEVVTDNKFRDGDICTSFIPEFFKSKEKENSPNNLTVDLLTENDLAVMLIASIHQMQKINSLQNSENSPNQDSKSYWKSYGWKAAQHTKL